ncbi:MAG TPA: hypothetical protein VK541_21075, partial [Pedobacter sp.]|nr:hypothetical protein [Pedobacter sp.]
MTKDNNRNSRDDKSKPGNRSTTGRKPSGTESSYKGKSKFDDKEGKDKKFGGAKDFKPQAARAGDSKDFKPRPPRDGDSRDFKPREKREGDARSFRPRAEHDGKDFKPRAART